MAILNLLHSILGLLICGFFAGLSIYMLVDMIVETIKK